MRACVCLIVRIAERLGKNMNTEHFQVPEQKLSENSRISVNCGIHRRANQNAEQTMQYRGFDGIERQRESHSYTDSKQQGVNKSGSK